MIVVMTIMTLKPPGYLWQHEDVVDGSNESFWHAEEEMSHHLRESLVSQIMFATFDVYICFS